MTDLANLRTQYRAQKAQLLQSMGVQGASGRSVRKSLHQLSALADDVLIALWTHAGLQAPYALLAVGGFGRGELFPHSDIDVLVLLPDGHSPENDVQLKSQLEAFIGSCWDLGLEIGSSVRTLSDCLAEAEKDVTVQTALLECRLIVGNVPLAQQFQAAFFKAIDAQAFYVAKTLELRQRHTKFEDTPYALEPNCKESPGGLRDLQVILWVAKAAGFGDHWADLAKNGLATPFEIKQIQRNESLLFQIRARLHLIAGRREDRIIFDLQNTVAEAFGFKTVETQLPATAERKARTTFVRASEGLMKRYYWSAKAVTQLNQILLMNIAERLNPSTHAPRPINARFNDKAGNVDVVSDDLYQREPHAILETFLVYQSTVGVKGLSARTLRALYNARGLMDAKFRKDPVNRATFLQILMQPSGITHAIRLMNQTSVLGRYLWVFRRIVGQMQHDLFHVYTVDQHIQMVLRNVRRFFIAEHSHEYPFCSQLASGWDKPWVLYVAALFHDIAKGRGGDHSELGAEDAIAFCLAHGLSRREANIVAWLTRHHLLMSLTAQKKDIADPDVVQEFARTVGSMEHLDYLFTLTVADINATNPKLWNTWRASLLRSLYTQTRRMLRAGLDTPIDRQALIEDTKSQAMLQLADQYDPDAVERIWHELGDDYFLRERAADVVWHTNAILTHGDSTAPLVMLREHRSLAMDAAQIFIYTQDQPNLFAATVTLLDQLDLDARRGADHGAAHGES